MFKRIKRYALIARWMIGASIWQKDIWKTRDIDDDKDSVEEVQAWLDQMKADGWQGIAGIGNRIYLRKFVERWTYPGEAP